MAKKRPPKAPVYYFHPEKTVIDLDTGMIEFHVITNLEEVLQNEPSLGFRLIARMRFDGVNPAVMLPGVWGFCDCHGWQWNPRAIPDEHGCMAYDSH